jgi:hypothetical protein
LPSAGNILYLIYGNGPHVHEAKFSIATLRRFRPESIGAVHVMTDRPAEFERLPVRIWNVDFATLESWFGPSNFCHRAKIIALRHVLRSLKEKVALVDSDTFFVREPRRLLDRIRPGQSVMYMIEGRLVDSRWPMNHRLAALLDEPDFREKLPIAPIAGKRAVQWNSGVVGVDPSDAEALDGALDLVDAILERGFVVVAEQIAFGLVLGSRNRLVQARNFVFHYNVSPQREPFRQSLPPLLERAGSMPGDRAAFYLYARRLRVPLRTRVQILAKDIANGCRLVPRRDRCACL